MINRYLSFPTDSRSISIADFCTAETILLIYIFICNMLAIAGQTVGSNGLTFFEETLEYHRLKRIKIFLSKISFPLKRTSIYKVTCLIHKSILLNLCLIKDIWDNLVFLTQNYLFLTSDFCGFLQLRDNEGKGRKLTFLSSSLSHK